MKQFSMRLTRRSSASPTAVYDVLADLRTHLEWGGVRQAGDFRLLSLDAPAGPAAAGTTFTSSGSIPMSSRRWEDRSTVTVADRPHTFEFVTHAAVHGPSRTMEATYRHRYEIAPAPGGSTVTYSFTQLEITNPVLRLGLPGVRTMTWLVAIPYFAGRGFRNLLAAAERGAPVTTTAAVSRS
jgi:hypothetical protein